MLPGIAVSVQKFGPHILPQADSDDASDQSVLQECHELGHHGPVSSLKKCRVPLPSVLSLPVGVESVRLLIQLGAPPLQPEKGRE